MSRWLHVILLRVGSLVRRRRLDAELDRELRDHLEHQIEENVASGMSPSEARRAALSTFGGVENVREEARDARGVAILDNLLRDLRYTLRGLVHEPMLLVAATVSIALGVSGNIAVLSLARAFIFSPPDVRDPSTLVTMQVSHGSHASYRRWLDLDASGGVERVAGYSIENSLNWLRGDAAVSIIPMAVTANFFDVTGLPIARGRAFTATEARAELDPHVVVVSHEFWQRELSADSGVVGRTLILNGAGYTVVGVLPPRLRSVAGFGIAPQVYVPLNRALVPEMTEPNAAVVQLLGRLRPGQSVSEARVALDAIDRRLERLMGDTLYGGVQEMARVGTFATTKSWSVVGGFFALLGLVSLFVLLIACANVAGLLIARGTRRRQEIAIRLAIGGSRARLMQQLLVEGFWLATLGAVAGLGLGMVFMRIVNSIELPVPIPLDIHLAVDSAIFFGALGLVVLTVLLCALLPAIHATRLMLVPALKREEPFYLVSRFTARGVLLVGQVMVSTVLLVTAFLFLRNLGRAQVTDPGFEVNHALIVQMGFVQGRADADQAGLLRRAANEVRSIPGVVDASFSNAVPLSVHSGSSNGMSARIGRNAEAEHVEFNRAYVGPSYFSTMGIRLLAGREFRDSDAPGTPKVAIISEEFSRRYFRGADPVGQHVRFTEADDYEIVGVVANSKFRTLGEDPRGVLYAPLRQDATPRRIAFVLVRTRDDPSNLVAPIRRAIGTLDHTAAVAVDPMSSALTFALLPSRIGAAVLGTLGALGLVLAAFGLYAIVAYNVSRRAAEIAIRGALGAPRRAILGLVVRDASMHVAAGLLLGLTIAAFVTAPLTNFLVAGLSARDPLAFGGTALAFLSVSVLASWIPARQAVRVSPVVAMRLD